MFDTFIQNAYWLMFVQVIITFLILPKMNLKIFKRSIEGYLKEYYPDARTEVERYSNQKLRTFFVVAGICMTIGLGTVLLAFFTNTELFNWDNQAGLMVLFFIAFVPILMLAMVQKGIFEIFERYIGSIRTASMKPRTWQQYFPKTMVALLVLGQIVFIATIAYFMQHPFDGFAGLVNLLGLLLINIVFAAASYVIVTNNKLNTVKDPMHREAIIAKRMKINLIAWIVAIFHLSISIWFAGLDLKTYNLILQSFYLQLVLCVSAYGLSPVAIDRTPAQS